MESGNNVSEYKKDIQVGITTLVASLGFFKTQELADFINSLNSFSLKTAELNFDYSGLIYPFLGLIVYFGYLLSVAASLFFIYKNKPKNHQMSVFFAVSCYFGLQILLILILMNAPK